MNEPKPARASAASLAEGGAVIRVRASPKAKTQGVVGVVETVDGPALSIRVGAPPDKGKANAALLRVLAADLGLAPGALSIVAGEQARVKKVRVACRPDDAQAIVQRYAVSAKADQ